MKLEFRLSISPLPSFYATVRLAALSLRVLGPPYDSARIVVSVGDFADLAGIRAATRWSEEFPIEWRRVLPYLFRDHSYLATHNDRFFAPTDADVVFMCDSDVCLVDRIDELVSRVGTPGRSAVAGLQAHYTPFPDTNGESEWRRLFAEAGLSEPDLKYRYSGDPTGAMGRSPAYFNYGFVALSRKAMADIAPLQASYAHMARALTNSSFFLTQVALTFLLVEAGVQPEPLSFAYNCSNDELPFGGTPEFRLHDPSEIRVVHYLRREQINRRKFLVDPAAFDAFIAARGLNPVNSRLRDHLLRLGGRECLLPL